MALQVQVYRAAPMAAHYRSNSLAWSTKQSMVCFTTGDRASNSRRVPLKVKSSLDSTAAASTVAVVGQVTQVCKDTFWPIVNAAGDKAVVLDMYTQWCGPCKPLAKELGIKVVPTFKILKDNKVVKEVTGAKLDDLVAAIEIVRSS